MTAGLGRNHRAADYDRRSQACISGPYHSRAALFPYVRSDKKDRPRIPITARLMADLLQTAGADRILTMHLHSPQGQGFFRIPTNQLEAAPILCDYLRESRDLSNYVLVAGDVGEAKDVGHYATRLNLPIAIVDKRRSGDDEVARAVNLIGDVKGKVALIIDDEVASAGTLVEAARFVLEHGAAAEDPTTFSRSSSTHTAVSLTVCASGSYSRPIVSTATGPAAWRPWRDVSPVPRASRRGRAPL